MQIVISIPDEIYSDIQKGIIRKHIAKVYVATVKGIPLPKGHGDLIDRDIAYDKFDKAGCSYEGSLLQSVPVVIKANKQ